MKGRQLPAPPGNIYASRELSDVPVPNVEEMYSAVTMFPGSAQFGGFDVSVGDRVAVEGKGNGVVRFVGLHAENGQPRIGVELDDPVGKNNGTVKVCGVLCPLYARRRSLVGLSCPGCLG